MIYQKLERGEVDGWMIATIGLIVGFIAAGAAAIYFGFQWHDARTNVDGQIEVAVSTARHEQREEFSEELQEALRRTTAEYAAPEEMGRVSFDYPRDWKVHVARDGSGGSSTYEAYIHPVAVPPIQRDEQYAMRVIIENTPYDRVIDGYSRLVDSGELRSSTQNVHGVNAVRYDGQITRDHRGAAVVFQVRDKVVTLRTDADTFVSEFNRIIGTVEFNR